jgi:hypothetical protein
MTTATIKTNILYGLGEGSNVSNTTYLAYALRWSNRATKRFILKPGISSRTL